MNRLHLLPCCLAALVYATLLHGCFSDPVLPEEAQYSIRGRITDSHTSQPVSGIPVAVKGVYPAGIFGIYSYEVGSATTDNDGYFDCPFKEYSRAEYYEFRINDSVAHNYGRDVFTITADSLRRNNHPVQDIQLPHRALLHIRLRNDSPVDNNDRIAVTCYAPRMGAFFNPELELPTPWNSPLFQRTGRDVAETVSIWTEADTMTIISWGVTKGSITRHYRDSIRCERDRPIVFDIAY